MKNFLNGVVRFAEKIENFQLRPYQAQVLREVTRRLITGQGGILTNLWARKSGKSETIKATILSLMSLLPEAAKSPPLLEQFPHLSTFKDGFNVAIAGPKMDTAAITFKRIRRQGRTKKFISILNELNLEVEVSNSMFFELSNGSMAQAFSGSETASSEGPDAHLLYLDEAQLLSPFSSYKILRPMVAACNGPILQSGTPGRKKCPFLSDIEFNIRKDPAAHQSVPYTDVTPFSEPYATFIESEMERLPGGRENPFFRMNYLLEWLLAVGRFVDPNLFLTLAKAKRGEDADILYGGIDWGKAGSSTTVTIMGRQGTCKKVVDLLRLRESSYDKQFEYLVPFLKKYFGRKMLKVASETNAAGAPNTERLQRIFGKNRIVEYFTSAAWKDKVFTELQTEIEGKHFSYFQDDSEEAIFFEKEFLDAEQEVRGNLLSVHKPDEEGSSDDFLISTANANILFPVKVVGHISGQSSGKKRASVRGISDY